MTAPSRYSNVKPCGTSAGYARHIYYQDEPCGPCRQAETERAREQRAGLRPKKTPPRHGTISGYRHLHQGDACGPCREAIAEYNREYRRSGPRGRRREPSTRELILDVLETWAYPMTAAVLVSKVVDIKPHWKPSAVKRMAERMIQDGTLQREERVGEWVISVP